MNNKEIAGVFQDIADILELEGENVFKIRAYQKVSHTIRQFPEELEVLLREGRVREVPGVGDAIEKKIVELVNTGRLEFYERIKSGLPDGIVTLLDVPGIGPKTAMLLVNELGVHSADELEKAILDGRVSRLPHIGEKTTANMLKYLRRKHGITTPSPISESRSDV